MGDYYTYPACKARTYARARAHTRIHFTKDFTFVKKIPLHFIKNIYRLLYSLE